MFFIYIILFVAFVAAVFHYKMVFKLLHQCFNMYICPSIKFIYYILKKSNILNVINIYLKLIRNDVRVLAGSIIFVLVVAIVIKNSFNNNGRSKYRQDYNTIVSENNTKKSSERINTKVNSSSSTDNKSVTNDITIRYNVRNYIIDYKRKELNNIESVIKRSPIIYSDKEILLSRVQRCRESLDNLSSLIYSNDNTWIRNADEYDNNENTLRQMIDYIISKY